MKLTGFASLVRLFTLFSLPLLLVAHPRDRATASGLDVGGWQSGFHAVGPDRAVMAIADYDGGLVIGGSFHCVGDVAAKHVAHWDGSTWAPLGEGLDGEVDAICFWKGQLIVGGQFTHAGGISSGGIAAWDGHGWTALGSGLTGNVLALEADGDRLLVGGSFTEAGGSPANRIAAWDGSGWTAFGEGTNQTVRAIAIYSGRVIAGGSFSMAGSVAAQNIAAWDGSVWSPLGAGVNGTVRALHAPFMGKLVVGGSFYMAGGATAPHLAVWNGAAWAALGADGPVYTLGTDPSGFLIVGGSFTHVWNADAENIARIGILATPMPGGGIDGLAYAVASFGDRVIVGGEFGRAGNAGMAAANLAANDEGTSTWSRLGCTSGNGIVGRVEAMIPFGGGLVVGGDIGAFGELSGMSIAQWTDAGWTTLGPGGGEPGIPVKSFGVHDGQLVMGGASDTAPVRIWTGSSWLPVGDGELQGFVYALAQHGANLIAAGSISSNGPGGVMRIASWDGVSWNALGAGLEGDDVLALASYQGDLYAGGLFDVAGGASIPGVARWDGSSWSALGDGLGSGYVTCLKVFRGDLYVGGGFELEGVTGKQSLARWDGSTWTPIDLASHVIEGLAVCDAGLAAVGRIEDSLVELWDGASVVTLAEGLDDEATGVAFYDDAMWVKGVFSKVDGTPSSRIAAWRSPATPVRIALQAEAVRGGASIAWDIPLDTEADRFHVERRDAGSIDWIDLTPDGLDRAARSYLDPDVRCGGVYEYRVEVMGNGGEVWIAGPIVVTIPAPTELSIDIGPNPSRGAATIWLTIPRGGPVVVGLYDVAGREVARLRDGNLDPGTHQIDWNGCGRSGAPLPAGNYYLRASGPGGSAVRSVTREP
jgi:trimeric autotransporter adhesin